MSGFVREIRTKTAIYMDIIDAVKLELDTQGVAKPTRVMQGANLSWTLMNDKLEELYETGFLGSEDSDIKDKRTKEMIYFTDNKLATKLVWSYRKDGMRGVIEMYDTLPYGLQELFCLDVSFLFLKQLIL